MVNRARRLLLIAVLCLPIFLVSRHFAGQTVKADFDGCTATVSPQNVNPNNQYDFSFNLTNNASTQIKWIIVTSPSSGDTVLSSSVGGWDSSYDSSTATFNNGTLDNGGTLGFHVQMLIGPNEVGASNWGVYAYDGSNGGPGSLVCQSVPEIDIQDVSPHISGVAVSSITSSSVTINWQTTLASTSKVNYGLDSGYGSSSALDSSLTTDHKVVLKNLKANTGYHYQVVSTTPEGGNESSSDGTFLTAVQQAALTQTVTVTVSNPGDKQPPTINLTSSIPKIAKTAPKISGLAADDSAVVRIEYSTDNGKNWLPVDNAPDLGGKNVKFDFTPANLDDGNYKLLARAIDGGANTAVTTPVTLVIDRLPPIVGGDVISVGPQILEPNQDGVIQSLAGVDQKITTTAVGGASSINLVATSEKQTLASNFSLTRSADSGLWSGILSFKQPGNYTLVAYSEDGAGNKTSRAIAKVNAIAPARILNKAGKPVSSEVTVYYLEPDSGDWVVWDGTSYGQENPQKTDQNGSFKLFLPPGKYYLKAKSSGYHALTSTIFDVNKPTPITQDLTINKKIHIKIGPIDIGWPSFATSKIDVSSQNHSEKSTQPSLIGKSLPSFNLVNSDGATVNTTKFLAKPTVMVVTGTWMPTTAEILPSIAHLQANKDINVILVGMQEDSARLGVYNKISSYNINWLADADSTLTDPLNIQSLPTYYFMDRSGTIKQIVTGEMSQQALFDELGKL